KGSFSIFKVSVQVSAAPQTPKAEPVSLGSKAAIDPALFENVGRNDPCPCGSGKKFKKCHGANL
ncbi:MAG: SEC-C metal-binding domain-containing protein, partial [Patescibacteria group bacterium]|nr:SEC-C metal-binding domain-containing protein [Patescibacteria group bacterium]